MSELYELNKKTGRAKIHDSEKFLKIFTLSAEDSAALQIEEHYDVMKTYSQKQLKTMAQDIPFTEYDYIINMAIDKAIRDYDPSGSNILSFLWDKLRGEVTSYRTKRDALQNKVMKSLQEDRDSYIYQKDRESGDNTIMHVDTESLDVKLEREDFHRRQLKAFKMAFSGIPRLLQYILERVGEGMKTREIAAILDKEEFVVSRDRNKGLSLILQRIMRSNHLTADEKAKLADFHGLEYEEIDIDNIQAP